MGKKSKVGKARKDKFYRLAKETGYRARSAFKLIQLNRKFEFLEKARVVVDLCAAPGGWLQVAAENTPISSLVVGVDLVSIRPIQKCTTFQADITTEKCKQMLQHELKTWKADVFLNDGAPNVGKNWVHDAYQQAELTLHAVKLATCFLKKGGCFVTKVFRSKDYFSLLWVLQQLFANVHATKPQASRNESAEIFVVCEKFLAPDKIDPKFLNPKYVFKDVEQSSRQLIDLLRPEKKKRHRDGYADGDYTLFHTVPASTFLTADNFLELLAGANQVVLDEARISEHRLTTTEMQECLRDIKVLGKKDIKDILTWRKKLREQFGMGATTDKGTQGESEASEKKEGEDDDEDEEGAVEKQLEQMRDEERRALKRKLKKTRREKIKLRHRMDIKMDMPNDAPDITDDVDIFNLKKIRSKQHLAEVDRGGQEPEEEDEEDLEWEDDLHLSSDRPRTVSYDRDTRDYLQRDDVSDEDLDSDPDIEEDLQTHVDTLEEEEGNPLVVDYQPENMKRQDRVNSWFSKSSFMDLEEEADEDAEMEQFADSYRSRGGYIMGDARLKEETRGEDVEKRAHQDGGESDSDSSDSDSDSDYDMLEMQQPVTQTQGADSKSSNKKTDDSFDVVPAEKTGATKRLDAVGMAIGASLVQSRKRRREITDNAYHRYTFDDDGLPEWFMKDEKKHSRIQLPVTKGDIQEYKDKLKAINAKPIRKVAEAKARKKKKEVRRLDRARKRAEVVSDTTEVSDREKWQQIKQIYKKAGLLGQKKKEVSYVVAKKGMGRRVRRPAGVNGPYRVVDKRLKKDKRGQIGGKQTAGKGKQQKGGRKPKNFKKGKR